MHELYEKLRELYIKYGELLRYLIIGGCTTVVSLGVYYGLVLTVLDPEDPFELQAANVASWIAAVTFAYVTNRLFVFASRNPELLKEAAAFYASRLSTLGMDMLIMFVFVSRLGFNDKIIKLVVQVVVTVANYILSKFLVFKKK